MKHIKSFEMVNQEEKYWSLDFKKPYLEIKVRKSELSEDRKTSIINYANNNKFEQKILYINVEKTTMDWNSFREMSGKYQGEIGGEITPEDIEQYEFEKDSEKYNL
jgi:hypothetical protein